jgi:hypothetical protein
VTTAPDGRTRSGHSRQGVRTDLDDGAGEIETLPGQQSARERLTQFAFAERDVEDVGRRGNDADEDLIVADRRGVDVLNLQNGGGAVVVEAATRMSISWPFAVARLLCRFKRVGDGGSPALWRLVRSVQLKRGNFPGL